jgi:PAS domain S-box-containing protein
MDILRVVVRQVGTVIDNVHLLTRLRQNAAELERRVEERTAELYAAKERVEAVLASVGDGVIVTDLAGKILTLNKAYEQQSGYQPQEAVGSKFFDLLNIHNHPKTLDKMVEDLRQGKIWSDELVVPRKDGSPFDVRLTIAPISDQTGEIVGFVGSL